MSFTHKLAYSVSAANESLNIAVSNTSNSEQLIDVSLTGADQVVNVAFSYANLKSFYLNSDKDVTLSLNSAGNITNQIPVVANHPLTYYDGGPIENPFGLDVTAMFFTMSGSETARIRIFLLEDSGIIP